MTTSSKINAIVSELERVIRNEIDDCERAIRQGNLQVAAREISDAESKLKRIARDLQAVR